MYLYKLFEQCLNAEYTQIGASANYAVLREGNTLFIFFQDSEGCEDWSVNLDFPAAAYKRNGKAVWYAHRGFLETWKRTLPYIQNYVTDLTVTKIVVTGYSHGAAVGVLCYEYIWYNRPDLRETLEGYGFGCPRVLWGKGRKAAREIWSGFTVIRNRDDLVTHLPPSFLGYYHVGKMLEIGQKGKYSSIDAHRQQSILTELEIYERKKHR